MVFKTDYRYAEGAVPRGGFELRTHNNLDDQ